MLAAWPHCPSPTAPPPAPRRASSNDDDVEDDEYYYAGGGDYVDLNFGDDGEDKDSIMIVTVMVKIETVMLLGMELMVVLMIKTMI